MTIVLLKSLGLWLLMVLLAIVNGGIREKLLLPLLGQRLSLPLSGLLLSALLFLLIYLTLPFLGPIQAQGYLGVGLFWFLMTLVFELLLGRSIAGKSWPEIFEMFNIAAGNLFLLALLTTLVGPLFAALLRGKI